MRALIERRLSSTRPPADPASEALARLPNDIAQAWFDKPLIEAAVLVPLLERDGDIFLLLTRRTEHLGDHPGQISFPGGRSEPGDSSPQHTALREAEEEVGLTADAIHIVGYLPPLAVVTGFAVAPVIGFVAPAAPLTIDSFEVAEVFEVPLGFFMDESNCQAVERIVRGRSMPFSEYRFAEYRIWGATAMMIRDFIKILKKK